MSRSQIYDGAAWVDMGLSPGGDALWTKDVDNPLTAVDDITSYSGTWSINTYLQCVVATTTHCRAFSDTPVGNAAMNTVEVEVEIPTSFNSSADHMRVGIGPTNGAKAFQFALRGDGNAYFEQDATAAVALLAYTIPAAGTWVKLRLTNVGHRYVGYIDGVKYFETNYTNDGAPSRFVSGSEWFPHVVAYSTTAMTARFRNLKAWSFNLNEDAVAGSGGSVPEWMSHLVDRTVGGETVHADDQEFNGTIGGTAVTPSGTAVWTQGKGLLSANFNNQSISDLAGRAYALTPTAAPVTIETCFGVAGAASALNMAGVFLSDGVATTSNVSASTVHQDGSNSSVAGRQGTFTVMGGPATGGFVNHRSYMTRYYLRVIWSAANTFKAYISYDGVTWLKSSTAAWSDTLTPTYYGVGVSTYGGTVLGLVTFEYLRVTESDLSV